MEKGYRQRESEKAKEVAKEYEDKGFNVFLEPSLSKFDLPMDIKNLNFRPDMIATSDDINLIIEVKTYESIQNNKLDEISEKIKNADGWEFELVYTNPISGSSMESYSVSPSYQDANEGIIRASKFLETNVGKEFLDASLLLIWAAVENALRTTYTTYKNNKKIPSPKELIRDSVILGIIGKNDQKFLESMMKKRNEAAHGLYKGEIYLKDLKKLVSLAEEIIEQVSSDYS